MDLQHDPATPLLGIYLKECDSDYYKGTSTPMFMAALFTIAKLWNQLTIPGHKGNAIPVFHRKWTELENIILSKVS
jgi:hypothetical protein